MQYSHPQLDYIALVILEVSHGANLSVLVA